MAQIPGRKARIYLEQLEESRHLAGYHAVWSDPKNLIWSTQEPKKTIEESRQWLHGASKASDFNIDNYAIMLPSPAVSPGPPSSKNEATLIGVVGVLRTSPAELGYCLAHEYWGQGYATEAVGLFLPLYWERMRHVSYVQAKVDAENVASVKILKKFGFRECEVLKGAFELVGKGLRDMVIYRLDRPANSC